MTSSTLTGSPFLGQAGAKLGLAGFTSCPLSTLLWTDARPGLEGSPTCMAWVQAIQREARFDETHYQKRHAVKVKVGSSQTGPGPFAGTYPRVVGVLL